MPKNAILVCIRSAAISIFLLALPQAIHAQAETPHLPRWVCGGPYDRCQPQDPKTGADIGPEFSEMYTLRQFAPGSPYIWASKERKARHEQTFGLLRYDNTWVIEPSFEVAGPLKYGLAVACERIMSVRCGGISSDGKIQVPIADRRVIPSDDGLVITVRNRKYGLSDSWGNTIVEPTYEYLDVGMNGAAHTVMIEGKRFDLNRDGTLGSVQIDRVVASCPNGLSAIQNDDIAKIRRSDGTMDETPIDNRYRLFKFPCGNGFTALSKGKILYFDAHGHRIASDVAIDGGSGFMNGHAAVRVSGRWGIINEKGDFTVSPRYDLIEMNREGNFVATNFSGKHTIDYMGRSINVENKTDRQTSQPINCSESKIFHTSNFWGKRLWGIKGDDGRVILPAVYLAVECFKNGIAWVADPNSNKWCPLGPNGPRRDIDCETARYPQYFHHFAVQVSNSKDPFERSVLWRRKALDFAFGLSRERVYINGDGYQAERVPSPY